MKIILATPLYPPDIAFPAPYIKELARRLAEEPSFEPVVVTYGDMPEEVTGVPIRTTTKRKPTLIRLIAFFQLLARESRDADIIYLENGASTELPFLILSLFSNIPCIFHFADTRARQLAQKSVIKRFVESRVSVRAKRVITDIPEERPEILPFSPYPQAAMDSYEKSWTNHLNVLKESFNYASRP